MGLVNTENTLHCALIGYFPLLDKSIAILLTSTSLILSNLATSWARYRLLELKKSLAPATVVLVTLQSSPVIGQQFSIATEASVWLIPVTVSNKAVPWFMKKTPRSFSTLESLLNSRPLVALDDLLHAFS